MRRDNLLKHGLIVFALALAVYFGSYSWIEHLRTRKGGWQVTFRTDILGVPRLDVDQPALRITNVTVLFPDVRIGTTNLASSIVFDRPNTKLPFGKTIYFDTTFLPGSIVFDLFGHEVQLLPRVLLLDRRETPWQSGEIHHLSNSNRLASPSR